MCVWQGFRGGAKVKQIIGGGAGLSIELMEMELVSSDKLKNSNVVGPPQATQFR